MDFSGFLRSHSMSSTLCRHAALLALNDCDRCPSAPLARYAQISHPFPSYSLLEHQSPLIAPYCQASYSVFSHSDHRSFLPFLTHRGPPVFLRIYGSGLSLVEDLQVLPSDPFPDLQLPIISESFQCCRMPVFFPMVNALPHSLLPGEVAPEVLWHSLLLSLMCHTHRAMWISPQAAPFHSDWSRGDCLLHFPLLPEANLSFFFFFVFLFIHTAYLSD